MTEHPAHPPRGASTAAVAAVLATKRLDLVRFFTLRLGSFKAGEALVVQIDEALADGRFRSSGGDDLASLYRFGSQLLAEQRYAQRPGDVVLIADRAGRSATGRREAQDERATVLVGQVWDLPPDAQLVLRLCKLEGYSFLTIAEMLDVPVDQVEARLREALHHLLEGSPRMGAWDGFPTSPTGAASSPSRVAGRGESGTRHPPVTYGQPGVSAKPRRRR